MHKRGRVSVLFALAIGLQVGCGDSDSPDNVAACEAYIATLECGSFDVSTVAPAGFCNQYDGLSCDISEYFDCLTANTKCVQDDPVLGDYLDQTSAATCASKATCQ